MVTVRGVILAVVVTFALAPLAYASEPAREEPKPVDPFAEALHQTRTLELGQRPPFAGVSRDTALTHRWRITTFYVVWRRAAGPNDRPTPSWAARRVEGDLHGAGRPVWASSTHCPALIAALRRLETLQAPAVDTPGLHPSEHVVVTLDGIGYQLWASSAKFTLGDGLGTVEMTSNVGTPLARWTDETDTALTGCWRTEPPEA